MLAAADLYRYHRHISTKQSTLTSSRGCRKFSLSLGYVILSYFLPEIPKTVCWVPRKQKYWNKKTSRQSQYNNSYRPLSGDFRYLSTAPILTPGQGGTGSSGTGDRAGQGGVKAGLLPHTQMQVPMNERVDLERPPHLSLKGTDFRRISIDQCTDNIE